MMLQTILEKTDGKIKWQEQVLTILHEIGHFNFRHCEYICNAICKRHVNELNAYKKLFVMGNPEGEQLWELLEFQAPYTYNRSHAYAYASIAWRNSGCKCGGWVLDNQGCQCGKAPCHCALGTYVDKGCQCGKQVTIQCIQGPSLEEDNKYDILIASLYRQPLKELYPTERMTLQEKPVDPMKLQGKCPPAFIAALKKVREEEALLLTGDVSGSGLPDFGLANKQAVIAPVCTCDLNLLMLQGCSCGQAEREKNASVQP